jgi:hypothetical protein
MGLDPSDGFDEQPQPVEAAEDEGEAELPPPPQPLFLHPSWSVGVVLVFAMLTIFAGLRNPIWFLIGSPFLLVMAVFIWVRFKL